MSRSCLLRLHALVRDGALTQVLHGVVRDTIVLLQAVDGALATVVPAIRQTARGLSARLRVGAVLDFFAAIFEQTAQDRSVVVVHLARLANAFPPATATRFHPFPAVFFPLARGLGRASERRDESDDDDEDGSKVELASEHGFRARACERMWGVHAVTWCSHVENENV